MNSFNLIQSQKILSAYGIDLQKGGEGSRGGKVIGHTKSGKPIYEDKNFHHNKNNKAIMNNLDWGKTTDERNKNLDKYESLSSDQEKESFLKKLKNFSNDKNQKLDNYDSIIKEHSDKKDFHSNKMKEINKKIKNLKDQELFTDKHTELEKEFDYHYKNEKNSDKKRLQAIEDQNKSNK